VWQLNDDADLRAEMVALLPRLRRFSIGLAGNVAEADDLLQSALEKALGRFSQFERGTRLDSWLFRIIQTTWIDSRRRAYRREVGMEGEVIERLPSASPEDESQTRYALSDVQKALARLPDDQRSVVLLVLVEGYSYEEAASMTGVPIGTVMSRLSRARRSMAASLEGHDHG
jgi:RNA polymerase sigma-70 factor (ECF subfamily)